MKNRTLFRPPIVHSIVQFATTTTMILLLQSFPNVKNTEIFPFFFTFFFSSFSFSFLSSPVRLSFPLVIWTHCFGRVNFFFDRLHPLFSLPIINGLSNCPTGSDSLSLFSFFVFLSCRYTFVYHFLLFFALWSITKNHPKSRSKDTHTLYLRLLWLPINRLYSQTNVITLFDTFFRSCSLFSFWYFMFKIQIQFHTPFLRFFFLF